MSAPQPASIWRAVALASLGLLGWTVWSVRREPGPNIPQGEAPTPEIRSTPESARPASGNSEEALTLAQVSTAPVSERRELSLGLTSAEEVQIQERPLVRLRYPQAEWFDRKTGLLSPDVGPLLRNLASRALKLGLRVRVECHPKNFMQAQAVTEVFGRAGLPVRDVEFWTSETEVPFGELRFVAMQHSTH